MRWARSCTSSDRIGDTGLTRTDSVMGSPGYMAPEQAEGKAKEAGPPADVYALGAILYELRSDRGPRPDADRFGHGLARLQGPRAGRGQGQGGRAAGRRLCAGRDPVRAQIGSGPPA